jgi:large subunit ribosomal protein L29
MKASEIRELDQAKALETLNGLKKEAFNLRFKAVNDTVENPLKMREIRRDIARIKTVMNEKKD